MGLGSQNHKGAPSAKLMVAGAHDVCSVRSWKNAYDWLFLFENLSSL